MYSSEMIVYVMECTFIKTIGRMLYYTVNRMGSAFKVAL